MYKVVIFLLFVFVFVLCHNFVEAQSPRDKAQAMLAKMTLDEKLAMVHGYGKNNSLPYQGNTLVNTRLGIPSLGMLDGPEGVADYIFGATAFPAAETVLSSWNVSLMYEFAVAMAEEQFKKGANVMLGPMVNMARVPVGGRNYEAFGEDPTLASIMTIANVKGIQSQNVIACAKHFVNNDQESQRSTISVVVDERTEWEIYYPPFQAAVDAGVGAIMCSYNKVNGTYACENDPTLNRDLKGKMGFQGWVLSDWGGTHSTVPAAINGLDQQMPDGSFFGAPLAAAVQNGQVPQSRIDDMVLRMLTSMYAVGIFDVQQPTGNISAVVQTPEHVALARRAAAEGTVLLKNTKNILPIDISKIYSIALIGDDALINPLAVAGGNNGVRASYIITPFQGIVQVATTSKVLYASSNQTQTGIQIAKSSDIAIVFVSFDTMEGRDRSNLTLPYNQDSMISQIAAVQPNTIVVAHCAIPFLMPWEPQVAAIISALFPGLEDGNAIADILFGFVNPSARSPVTFPLHESQTPLSTPEQYPGVNGVVTYSEKLLIGYRWFDANNQVPLYPFGHGLSYTQFTYSNLKVTAGTSAVLVSVDITNSGKVNGAEVAQLYIGYPPAAGEPPKVLRAFEKSFISVGATTTVRFSPLYAKDFSIWNIETHNWQVISGNFSFYVGASSRDIRLQTFLVV